MIIKKDLSKIGIGTWGIGGFAERNPQNDDLKQIEALAHMFRSGMNYVELNIWTSQGQSVELASKGLETSGIKRDNVFLSQAIYSYTASTQEQAEKELSDLCKIFKTDYMDSISLTATAITEIGKENVIEWYKKCLADNKVRYINLNNPSIEILKEFHEIFGEKLFSIEIGFNFEIRENFDNGIIDYANKNDILNVIYQSLRRNRTSQRNWPLLVELSEKYNKTQNQILLNWIARKGMLPLTKSESIEHINEHLESTKFEIDADDIKKLDEFRPPNYVAPKVFWTQTGEGVRIDQLSNKFDEEYDKQQQTS
jgi:diketogulonate reductase-like aldo/keto reductase